MKCLNPELCPRIAGCLTRCSAWRGTEHEGVLVIMAKINPNLRKRVCPNCGEINGATINACVDCRHDISAERPVVPEEIIIETAAVEFIRRFGTGLTAAQVRDELQARPITVTPVTVNAFGNGAGREIQTAARAGAVEALVATPVEVNMTSHDAIVNDVNIHTDALQAHLDGRHDTTDQTLAARPTPTSNWKGIGVGVAIGVLLAFVVFSIWRSAKSNEELTMVSSNPATIAVPATITPSLPAPATAAPPPAPATQASVRTKAQCQADCVIKQKLLFGNDPTTEANAQAVCMSDPDCAGLN